MSRLHRIQYLTVSGSQNGGTEPLAVATEDGRVVFYSTQETRPPGPDDPGSAIPVAQALAQLGGKPCGLTGRVKDFAILHLTEPEPWSDDLCVVTGGSDGAVRFWRVRRKELEAGQPGSPSSHEDMLTNNLHPRSVGTILKTYDTGNRITCLVAFVMQQPHGLSARGESESTSDGNETEESGNDKSDGE
jgi:protein MAK11